MDVVLRGQLEEVDDIEKLEDLTIEGPLGLVKLGSISRISLEQGPVSISRFDLERSATISGEITAEDTQTVGVQVQEKSTPWNFLRELRSGAAAFSNK